LGIFRRVGIVYHLSLNGVDVVALPAAAIGVRHVSRSDGHRSCEAMQLTVREAACLLHVTENTVYRWISEMELPTQQFGGQHRMDRAQLLEWATLHVRELPSGALVYLANKPDLPRLDAALSAGGVHEIAASGRDELWRGVARCLPLPDGADRDSLARMLLSRETVQSSSIGKGIALPHPRSPLVMPLTRPAISLCYLSRPLDIPTPDGQPVQTLFVMLSPTVRTHLQLLARLIAALKDPELLECVRRRAGAAEVLALARKAEESAQTVRENGVKA
jgi:PTS system nitrogen regulatory IIA component